MVARLSVLACLLCVSGYVVGDVPKVVFEANGGKIGSQAKVTLACAGDEEAMTGAERS